MTPCKPKDESDILMSTKNLKGQLNVGEKDESPIIMSGRRNILTGIVNNTGQHSPKGSHMDDDIDVGGVSQRMMNRRALAMIASPKAMNKFFDLEKEKNIQILPD